MENNSHVTEETHDHKKVEENAETKKTTTEHTEAGKPEVKEVKETVEPKQ